MDYKTRLQERVQAVLHKVPRYRVLNETGPDHDKRFEVSVDIQSGASGTGSGRSKKEAEQAAASTLLEAIDADESLLVPKQEGGA